VSGFLTELDLRDNLDGRRMQLLTPLRYQCDLLDRVIEVPAGFTTDFCSVPRILWNILPPHGRYSWGAVVHDYLYQTGGVTRAQADGVLFEAMTRKVTPVPWYQRYAIYYGLRLGGWKVWNGYRRKQSATV
jgi:uncharacterized protein DUF1353